MSKPEGLKMVEVAVDLLSYLAENNNGIGPREISRKFDIGSTSAQRIVTSLERKNCLYFDETTQKYKLGYGVIRFAQGSLARNDVIKFVKPYMENLREYTGETICLNSVVEGKRMTVFQVESNYELRWTAEIGKLFPIYTGASGKAILANLDESVRTTTIAESNILDKDSLKEELERIAANGFAVTKGERVSGGVGIAVPLILENTIMSLSIYGPTSRLQENEINMYTKKLKETVDLIKSLIYV
ncbi:IclR family transcriptional regulator [Alkalihalobacillus sp. BA299]|uniref:IclR family transcriptional regulator n=1 Tax=Alkalihalobacillus sp. BA299 TaxID=2815938 RepID=UPI001ADC399F|nr:IclR family transcriptional regulator [Alkalihalobacillus sp. BA299]